MAARSRASNKKKPARQAGPRQATPKKTKRVAKQAAPDSKPRAKPRPGKAAAEKIAGVSNETVTRRTGKGWADWLRLLDAAGARTMNHTAIAAWLHDHHGRIGGWWCQMVAVGYEQARGLRAMHQKAGGFSASKSRTFPVPIARLYEAFADPKQRAKWLRAPRATVRKATPHKTVRMNWEDGTTRVDVYLLPKGEAKSSVNVQHEKLAKAADVARVKAIWEAAFERLAKHLAR